jgi:hypothetical protein
MPAPTSPGGAGIAKLFDQLLTADTASFDTGLDGVLLPGGYSALEVLIYSRTDEAVTNSQINLIFNNDSGSTNYDLIRVQNSNTTVTGAVSNARANLFFIVAGASCTANVFSVSRIVIPNYAGTTGFKVAEFTSYIPDETAANMFIQIFGGQWRSTAAINRLGLTTNTGAKNFKAGSRVTVYGMP